MVADQMYESEKIDKYYLDAAKICPYKKNHFQIEEFAVEKENMNGYENTVQHDCKYVEKKKDSKIGVKLVASRRRRDENKKSNYILAFGRNFSYNIRNWGEGLTFEVKAADSQFAGEEWYDQIDTVEVNRENARATFTPYETQDKALENEKSALDDKDETNSKWYKSLNGEWDLNMQKSRLIA